MTEPLLAIQGLDVRFATPDGEVPAVRDVGLAIEPGECVGIVGESGSGKTQAFLAVMGLLAANGRASGSVRFEGEELLGRDRASLDRIRGRRLAMVFQDPMTSLNPYLTVSRQMTEVLMVHQGLDEPAARAESLRLLDRVGIPDAAQRFDHYPHAYSGGMRQRAMLAMALLCRPALLIADEPTTALDVTVQAQILALLAELRRETNAAIVLITHDLGVIAGLADRVGVMYAGALVEVGPAAAVFASPRHPYTRALLGSTVRLDRAGTGDLVAIDGQPPNPLRLPPGCAFSDRCPQTFARCLGERPPLRDVAPARAAACHLDTA
ncbi:MAG: ABC transporter ATP-binding protein [Alphaproteobacteria bacterium]|nr:ABC transporter ATP-binding protein [Alphaproteobacteria bacterium]